MAKNVEDDVKEYPKMVYPHRTGDKVVESGPGFVANSKEEEDEIMGKAKAEPEKPAAAKPAAEAKKTEWGKQ